MVGNGSCPGYRLSPGGPEQGRVVGRRACTTGARLGHSRLMAHDLAVDLLLEAPSLAAVEDAERTWTRGELAAWAGRVQTQLERQGIGPGSRVAVAGPHDGRLVAAMLGARATGALVLLVPREDPEAYARGRGAVLVRSSETGGNDELRPVAGEDAWGLSTSGSTGAPKVVVMGSSALRHTYSWSQGVQPYPPGGRCLCPVPLFHLFGLAQLYNTLIAGAVLVLPPMPLTSAELAEACAAADVVAAVPSMAGSLVAGPRFVSLAGEVATPELRRLLAARVPTARFWLGYGQTESAGRITSLDPSQFLSHPDLVGEPRPGLELRLTEVGELCVRGPGLAHAYLDDPEGTAARWRDGWLHTGDRFEHTPDGWRWIGRVDLLFKRRGEWVSPERVEGALRSHPLVETCVVRPAREGDELVPVAYAVAPGADPIALRRHLFERLAGHEVPVRVMLVDTLPTTPLGKPARGPLP